MLTNSRWNDWLNLNQPPLRSPPKKARLAEIQRVYQGKLAEREIFLQQQLNTALADQKFDEVDKICKQAAGEKARLEEEREEEKERVRRAK